MRRGSSQALDDDIADPGWFRKYPSNHSSLPRPALAASFTDSILHRQPVCSNSPTPTPPRTYQRRPKECLQSKPPGIRCIQSAYGSMSGPLVLPPAEMKPLPAEVIAFIFGFATECDPRDPELAHARSRDLRSFMAVSRQWLQLGLPLLYKEVMLNSFDSVVTFALLLVNPVIPLGDHVRFLRTGSALDGDNDLLLRRLLDYMPNIVGLRASLKQCRGQMVGPRGLKQCRGGLKEHPLWNKIEHLQLFQDNSLDAWAQMNQKVLFFEESCFPTSLHTLTLEGGVEWLRNIKDWSEIGLQGLTTLVIKGSFASTSYVYSPPEITKLPKIKCLEFADAGIARLPVQSFVKMVTETSKTLTRLEIRESSMPSDEDSQLLSPRLLRNLENLQHLIWSGPAPFYKEEFVRTTFPSSLREANLTIMNTHKYAGQFLNLVLDQSFLPHLEECPTVNLLLDSATSLQVKPSAIQKLLRRGARATRYWREHRGAKFPTKLSSSIDGFSCITCLPDTESKTVLQPETSRDVAELKAKGRVASKE